MKYEFGEERAKREKRNKMIAAIAAAIQLCFLGTLNSCGEKTMRFSASSFLPRLLSP